MNTIHKSLILSSMAIGCIASPDKKAPSELRSQAQGFIFFVTFGSGLLIGNFINGQLISEFSGRADNVKIYSWNSIRGINVLISVVMLAFFIILFKKKNQLLQSLKIDISEILKICL